MNIRQAGLLLVPVLAAAVGCSAQAASPPATPAANPAVSPAPPAQAASTPKTTGNITVEAPAGTPPGPFKIKPLHCGRFSKAQRARFGTTAKGGLVYRFANVSAGMAGSPSLTVNFTTGSDVAGSNVTGSDTSVGPGQSAEGEVDALNGSGGNLHFTGCDLTEYAVQSDSQGDLAGSYAP